MLTSFAPRPSARPRRGRVVRATGTALAVVLALGACVAPKEQSSPQDVVPTGEASATPGPVTGGIEAFYAQELSWSECGAGLECATVQAPMDWDDPAAATIELALRRAPATGGPDQRIGSLLVNPGGPGSSGADFVEYARDVFSERLVGAFDLVGFDPRGVGASSAVSCGDPAEVDRYLTADYPVDDAAGLEAAREAARAFGEACAEATGPLIEHVDTVSAAKDMDLLRAVLGDEQLHYAGFSYGTLLGATYAELFPDKVGRLLLDAAVDPANSSEELVVGQAAGFEEALRAYVAYCLDGPACPLTGDVDDGMQQIADLMDRVEARPLPVGEGRELNSTLAFYGLVVTLYDDETWTYLTLALEEALTEDRGAIFLELANFYLDRTADGTYGSNQMVAFTAINCLDYPAEELSYAELDQLAGVVEAEAPTFGRDFVMAPGCETWPVEAVREPAPTTAEGAAPILVVGTTGDPATPYEWSVSLAEQLASGSLLTWEGEGHTAYGRAGDCITDAVDAYLIEGVVPPDGTVCTG
ncbi:proteinase [Actinotalea ferrariae CF5-4]|uniref:Proteinase n=1 Tax=Actinotalea ferrariae CF5-4 TaxID=948458 RepID=A0A021VMR8_9CELL|nr:alpha/beta hydrolase [Actinotalea ferrariae]EYR62509.1 proteinase [Actinotalea ferrariae CF5-4]